MKKLVERINVSSAVMRHYRSTPKMVGLELNLTLILTDEAAYCCRCQDDVSYDWKSALEGLPFRRDPYYDGANTSYQDGCETHGNCSWVTNLRAHYWLAADDDKPSNTLSESNAMRMIANRAPENEGKGYQDRLTLEEIYSLRIQAVLDQAKREVEASNIAKQANSLIAHVTKQVREQAMSNTGFEAKLETLKAEFVAEQEACLAAYLQDQLQADCDEPSKTEWHPRAIQLASERADECLEPAIRSFLGRGMDSNIVKAADVFPEETVEEETEKVA